MSVGGRREPADATTDGPGDRNNVTGAAIDALGIPDNVTGIVKDRPAPVDLITGSAVEAADEDVLRVLPFIRFIRTPTALVTEARLGCGVDDGFPIHFHTDWQISIIERGTGWVIHHGREIETPAGTMFVMPPLEPHANRSPKTGVAYRNCLLSAAFLDGVARDLAGCPAAHLRLPILVTDPHGHGRMSALHRALGDGRSRLDLDCRVLDACQWLIRQSGPHPLPSAIQSSSRLARVREFLLDVPTANVSLAELAAMAELNSFRFARLFKASFGMAPHAFQVQVRVERAKRDIRDGLALAEAALRAGFADQSHLHRHFRRIVGITPGQFQAEMGKNVQDHRV